MRPACDVIRNARRGGDGRCRPLVHHCDSGRRLCRGGHLPTHRGHQNLRASALPRLIQRLHSGRSLHHFHSVAPVDLLRRLVDLHSTLRP